MRHVLAHQVRVRVRVRVRVGVGAGVGVGVRVRVRVRVSVRVRDRVRVRVRVRDRGAHLEAAEGAAVLVRRQLAIRRQRVILPAAHAREHLVRVRARVRAQG